MTFGSSDEQTQICAFMKLSVILKDGGLHPLTLFSVPLICEPLTCQPVSFCQENFGHAPSQLHLADPSDGASHLNIDILIGSDQYWELVTGETSRGPAWSSGHQHQAWLGLLSGPVASCEPDTPSSACLVTHVDGCTP